MLFNNEEVNCYYEKAFERHRRDIKDVEEGVKPHLRFNQELGLAYVEIIEQMKHYKGELAGQKIKLEEWQVKVIVIAFGWEKLNSQGKWVRRFSKVFLFIPRKNGKTLLMSAIVIADSIIRVDMGGEVAFFATKKEQAKLAWTGVEEMAKAHKDLKENSTFYTTKIIMEKTKTEFYYLGRDSNTQDGLNISIGAGDEIHAHKDNSMIDVVETSQGARIQPLMLHITTAGIDLMSPGYNEYEYACKILEETIEDDNFFAFVAQPDKEDDVFEELTWAKANPNYGISVSKDYMEDKAKKAYERPELLNNFKVKNLNIWTNSSENYISYEDWKKCKGELKGEGVVKHVDGFDLSVSDDFSSRCKIWKYEDKYYVKMNYYIPKDNVQEREKTLKVPLYSWVNEGWITATPGRAIDYDYIYEDLSREIENSESIVYDPYKAKHLVKRLEDDGCEDLIPLRQGFVSLTSPTKFLSDLVKEGKLVHDGNPVTIWMISNLTIMTDAAGNIKPDKSDPNKKIDGPAAIVNALAYFESSEDTESVYETRGLRIL